MEMNTSRTTAVVRELIAIIGVIAIPSYVSSIVGLVNNAFQPWDQGVVASTGGAFITLAYCLPQTVLLWWAIVNSGQPQRDYGWRLFRPLRDVLTAAVIVLGWLVLLTIVGWITLRMRGAQANTPTGFVWGVLPQPESDVVYSWRYANNVIASLGVAIVEEVAFRGYLLVRAAVVVKSRGAISLVSSAAWAGLHVYQGVVPVAIHLCEGLLLCAVFWRIRRLWPLIIAHAAIDALIPVVAVLRPLSG
jgi:membrane protease YdiL (CAAX protease family)